MWLPNMSILRNGMPDNQKAFPMHIQDQDRQYAPVIHEGMDLRDYFAAKAMQTLIRTYGNTGDYEKCAIEAFNFADAMLEEKSK